MQLFSIFLIVFFALPAVAQEVGEYPFDSISRAIEKGDDCPEVELVDYAGTHVKFSKSVKLERGFVTKMVEFEKVIQQEAERVFGAKVDELVHRGGYRCRPVTGRKSKWSEHAFGNALDIASFRIGKKRVAFGKHWRVDDRRSEFLHSVVRRAVDEKLFRIILGPGDPGHETVLHVDFGTSWYVRVDLPDRGTEESDEEGVIADTLTNVE